MGFGDLAKLRSEVRRIVQEDVDGRRLLVSWNHIRRRHHQIEDWQLLAVLLHGSYKIDKDYRASGKRFNAESSIAGQPYKVVFEVHSCPHDGSIVVISGYEVSPMR